jgi:hypothetical protein
LIVKNSRDSFNLKDFSIETWLTTNSPPLDMYILNQQYIASGVYNGWGLFIDNSGKADFGMASSSASGYYQVASRTSLQANQWYNIVATFDSQTLKLYMNGVLEDSATYSGGTYPPSTADARIACQTLQGGSVRMFLNGKLDELKFYRYALSADAIKAHYEALRPQD